MNIINIFSQSCVYLQMGDQTKLMSDMRESIYDKSEEEPINIKLENLDSLVQNVLAQGQDSATTANTTVGSTVTGSTTTESTTAGSTVTGSTITESTTARSTTTGGTTAGSTAPGSTITGSTTTENTTPGSTTAESTTGGTTATAGTAATRSTTPKPNSANKIHINSYFLIFISLFMYTVHHT